MRPPSPTVRRDGGACTTAPGDVVRAYAPYLIIVAVFVVATRVPAITGKPPTAPGSGGSGIESVTRIYEWPGPAHHQRRGRCRSPTTFKLNSAQRGRHPAAHRGHPDACSCSRSVPVARCAVYGRTLHQLPFPIVTVMAVLALGFVMNEAGETMTLGLWLAGRAALFALCRRSSAGSASR